MKSLNKIICGLMIGLALFSGSCRKKGCMDSLAKNYDTKAKKDDGTCSYNYGGKDYGQIDVGAEVDLNNEYDIYIDGDFIGRSLYYFPTGLNCGNLKSVGKVFYSGNHTVKAVGNGGTEVRQSTVYLGPQQCKIVLIESLTLITTGGGGGSSGYNCVSGNCEYVSSGAGYATLSACQSACGSASTGSITIWTGTDLGCGNIYVTLTSAGNSTISVYYASNPGCGASGCANFSGLPYGTYSYSATSDGSCTWNGSISLSGACSTLQFTL